jgi:hypothetical protein
LKDKWKIVSERQQVQLSNGQDEDDHPSSERCEAEVIEEQVSEIHRMNLFDRYRIVSFKVICYLTRDFLDLIRTFLARQIDQSHPSCSNGQEFDETSMDEMISSDEQTVNDPTARSTVATSRTSSMPTEFALKILQQSASLTQSCLLFIFDGLAWPDTSSVMRMCQICQALLKQLAILICNNQEFLSQIYISILCALKTHGDNEPLVCTLLSLVLTLDETFQDSSGKLFDDILMKIPNVNAEQVRLFREKMRRQVNGKPTSDKQKRDLLKSLVQPLMATNIAHMFRREPLALNNLPPLMRFSKKSLHPILQQKQFYKDTHALDDDQGLASLFQADDN